MTDQMVLQTQQWLNKTYGNDPPIQENQPGRQNWLADNLCAYSRIAD